MGQRLQHRTLLVTALVAAVIGGAASAAQAGAAAARTLSIAWSSCVDDPTVDCGTIAVPLDYAHPHGATIALALERRRADDQAHKIGSIFVNPGGPGVSGRNEARNAAQRFSPDVLAHFDVIGFDPRGVGLSAPLQCFATNGDAAAVLSGITDVPLTDSEVSGDLAAFRSYTGACGQNGGPIAEHMSTLDVARDLDLMRQAVGDAQLTYAGYSYGTLIGETYANLFPRRVRAVILDGPIDANEQTNHRLARILDRASGFEAELDTMLSACKSAGPVCPFFGGDRTPRQKFDRLLDRLRRGPLATGTSTVTISDFTDSTSNALYLRSRLAPLATWFQQLYVAAFGTPAAMTAAFAPSDAYKYNVVDAFLGTGCVDGPMPHDQALYPALADAYERVDPTFGRWQVYGDTPCATWPITNADRYAGPWNRATAAPLLVVAQTHDPATPYPGALRLMSELGNARLLTVDGFGHLSQDSTCAAAARNAYLLTRQLPEPGKRCAQDVGPF